MKKLLAIILSLALLLSLSACAAPQEEATTSEATPASEVASTSEAAPTSEDTLVLKLGLTAPAGSSHEINSLVFKEKLEEVSGGKMSLEVISGGSLGNTAAHYSQLEQGTLDFFLSAFDTGSILKEGGDFAVLVVPFLFEDNDHYHTFVESDLLEEMMGKVEDANGIRFMGSLFDVNPRSLSTNGIPVSTPEDLANLKIRMPEAPAISQMFKAWGANPMIISGGEMFTALQTGMADAQDNGLVDSNSAGIFEVQDHYMELNYIYTSLLLYMSQATEAKLTEEQISWINEAIALTDEQCSSELWDTQYDATMAEIQEMGVTIVEVDRDAFIDSAAEIAADFEGVLYSEGLYQQIKDMA